MDLKGKVALVTGGGSGIGQGIATKLAIEGANVVVCGRRQKPLEKVAAGLEQEAGRVEAIQADVSQVEDVQRLVDETVGSFGRIDVLVNNAGIGGGQAIHEHNIGVWDEIIAVNLRGPFLMARAVLPLMREQGSGHLINISSESATTHYKDSGAYGVSKHALNALSEYIQAENQDFGIRVDTICPGMVVTEMTEGRPGLDHSKCLEPADIADLVHWLLTRRANIKIGTPILIQTMKNPWS